MKENSIAKIVCGASVFGDSFEFDDIMKHMHANICGMTCELLWLMDQNDVRFSLLGPFIGRSLLETCLTTLVGRVDPYRLLVLRYQQTNANYDPGGRREAATKWTGDILASKPPPLSDLTNPDKKYSDISRALLGDHYDVLLWQRAFVRTLDAITNGALVSKGEWLIELEGMSESAFIASYRSKISVLYSKLSKGIHHEFVIPPESMYDRATVVSMLRDTVQYCCMLGVVANEICHVKRGLSTIEVLELVQLAESIEIK